MNEKGLKKVNILHIFSPIYLTYKIEEKRLKMIHLRRAAHHYNKLHLGKNMNQEGGGAKI